MQRHNIPHLPRRLALLTIAILAVCLPALAAVPSAKTPTGAGTTASPYLISTVEEFMFVKDNPSNVYRQTADLDFTGYVFDNGNGNSVVNANFTGTYDGNGFTIKNVTIDWSIKVVSGTHSYIGIFRTIGQSGKVRNLILDNITLQYNYTDENNLYHGNNNELGIEIGILSGNAYNNAEIENIIVKNSNIKATGDPNATNYFVGGLVGDVRKNVDETNSTSIKIRNISANVDISLPDCTRDQYADKDPARPHQFYVGGIVGRIRTGANDAYPLYTYFGGTINAPLAMVGPCYGGGRYDQKAKLGGYFTSVYAGQIAVPGAPGNPEPAEKSVLGMAGTPDADANRYFSNYKVWHYDSDASGNLKCDEVTANVPSNSNFSTDEQCYYGTRTFSPNYPYSDKTEVAYKTAKGMASFQGVNHGTYTNSYTTVLDMYNKYVEDNNTYNTLMQWHYIQGHGFDFNTFAIVQTSYNTVTPRFSSSAGINPADYKIRWTLTKSENGETVTVTKNDTSPLSISEELGSADNDVNRYKSVKAELINSEDVTEFASEIDLPDIDCLVVCRSNGNYLVKVRNSWPEIKYRFRCYIKEGNTVLQEKLTDLVREDVFSLPLESTADNIVVEICDKDGNVYYYHDRTKAIINLDISGDAPDAKIVLKREKSGNSTYFAAYVYGADDLENPIAGGCPYTDPEHYIDNPNVQYVWECTTDPSNTHTFTKISNSESYFKGYVTETYYKVTAYYNGWELDYAFLGSKDVIFVYDKDKHNEAETLINTGNFYTSKPLSTFDGKDSWTDKIGSHNEDFPNGDDTNDGRNPSRAVKTLEQAYKLLDPVNGPDDNIIVVMGLNYDEYFFDLTKKKAKYDDIYNKAATITGMYGKNISGGAIVLANNSSNPIGLRGATKFENISLACIPEKAINAAGSTSLFLYANLHDLTFGENVVMRGYTKDSGDHGLIDNNVPNITIIGGVHNFNESNSDLTSYREKCKWNQDKDFTTITIHSGCFGRIMGGARNDGDPNSNSHNIFGNNTLPHRVRINIDIKHNTSGDEIFKEYCPDIEAKYDIGLLAGGQTDGTVYSEAELSMDGGTVGRFISGNITFCRATDVTTNSVTTYYPYDSYFGSTVLNFRGGDIKELYGGALGRIGGSTTGNLKAYFYGRSVINIEGGTISSSLCGASAGGVSGVGTDLSHTDDIVIPYVKDGVLKYGDYNTSKGYVATMPLSDGNTLDFNNTYCEVNVKSGTVNGNIYGAGGGESSVIGKGKREKLSRMTGWLFGNCSVNITEDEGCITHINGNIYGGGMGSKTYYDSNDGADVIKDALAQLHGNSRVEISGGTIKGNVYAAGMGIASLHDMAAVYGTNSLTITGGTILGNIYGGSQLADLRRFELSETEALALGDNAYSEGEGSSKKYYLKGSGCTNVSIDGGVIGNCIFGGSEGLYVNASSQHKSIIEGDAHVTINGGEFIGTPYIDYINPEATVPTEWNVEDYPEKYRNFNIYGGGNVNCDITGTAYVKIYTSLLNSKNSFVPKSQNPNAVGSDDDKFKSAYDDITYRRFCVYGGGYGENTTVGHTDVYVTIPPERMDVTVPHGYTLDSYLPKQSFFDIAGGGYAGNVGYWVDKDGKKVKDYTKAELSAIKNATHAGDIAALYHTYVGGNCKVTIDGYTYARKVIGGGFYGSCNNTNTHVRCGSLRQVYGGSLLGDVHQRAYLQFGNRIEDFIRKVDDTSTLGYHYIYDADGTLYDTDGEYLGDKQNVPSDIWTKAESRALELNKYIFITENIYGGNDVKGIIGTKKWEAPSSTAASPIYALATNFDQNNYQETIYPLFCTKDNSTKDNSTIEDCGIVFNIYGGTFMGDVYGAGNGHYRGYYVPEWVRYSDGPKHLYRNVKDGTNSSATSKVYDGRPMVGNVNINIRGNSEIDRIHFTKNFYGGGRECTIGQWNTLLPVEDPRRLVEGGQLHVNFGGYTDIDGNVYMGSEGSHYATQPVVPETAVFSDYNGTNSKKTEYINKLGDIAYYHWYYDSDDSRYLPGFPAKGKVDGNYGFTGEHMFRAYLKNIEMECDVKLTFYRNLYERGDDDKFVYETETEGSTPIVDAYGNKLRKRKSWIPYEMAVADVTPSETKSDSYDAPSITMTSFFLGGACGSMSNNKVMDYTYPKNSPEDPDVKEKCPSIYRISLPKGVTIKDAVVMGSQDAEIDAYSYDDADCKTITKNETNKLYTFKGGMVTHSSIAFDLIVYNDKYHQTDPKRDLPANFYTSDTSDDGTEDYKSIKDIATNTSYTLSDGTNIKRKKYSNSYPSLKYHGTTTNNSENITVNKYDFAVLTTNGNTAYIGPRAKREGSSDHLTVVKLGASCTFQPQLYDPTGTLAGAPEDVKHANRYGGIIYGGCYNSGITIGDVVLNVASDMLGAHYDINSPKAYGEFSRLRYNKGRVFGGGFGENTDIQGNTYVNLINEFRGMNVFGGGCKGNVTGTANVTYIGEETRSYIYGAIYGGGLQGYVGDPNNRATNATVVSPYSGNVDKVYGGSCMGDLYGYAYVELTDKVQSDLDHLDYDRLKDKGYDWTDSRLIAGTVYGGNDITGNIYYDTTVPLPATVSETITGPADYAGYTTAVYVHEVKDEDAKNTPGSDGGYNGFPLIGSLYGGSNGNYGVHGTAAVDGSVNYTAGEVSLATGTNTDFINIPLADKVVPTIDKAMVDIRGGTIIDAYTGGNMATLTNYGKIHVKYSHQAAKAGFASTDDLDRMWNALHLSSEMQLDEVIKDYHSASEKIFEYNIFRLFGGNDNADMAIQPEVKLIKGELGSVYSGGNFGAMTYYQKPVAANPTAEPPVVAVEEKGLHLTIDSPDITIDNVYGGGRLGDIIPQEVVTVTETDPETGLETTTKKRQLVSNPGENFYGATLTINSGKIQHIYGGNDVAGYIYNGTNVNIHGAIAGDVYCAGNGDYPYLYDKDRSLCNYSNKKIIEKYQEGDNTKGTRYFILPAKDEYPYDGSEASAAQVIMAVNSYRPHVERSKLNISGSSSSKVWVGGNVYCGGNSATVTKKDTGYDVIFNIGDYVTLNGVFLGSNGENLALGSTIQFFEELNGVDMTRDNDLTAAQLPAGADQTAVTARETLYPKLLDLYMRAVETTQQPEGFEFGSNLTKAYIGEFCVGGNRGSIMTDKRITIDFPESLNIYGRIIGGSKNANVTYNGTTHIGGLTVPLAGTETVKVELKVRSKFLPLEAFPATGEPSGVSLGLCMVDENGEVIPHDTFGTFDGTKYYKDKQCNVYGGCFTSGKTVGGINIDLYSDMMNYAQIDKDYENLSVDGANNKKATLDHPEYIDRQAIINDITHPQSWRNFTIVGAGYGVDTEVWGDINVRLLPTVTTTGEGESAVRTVKHPSAGTIFGGSQEGLVVGNTNVEIRDGRVFTNVYGASEAAKMYGSTSVIVGYPRYYRALQSGNYRISRADYMSTVAREDLRDEFGEVVVPKAVAYRKGDIIAQNVYDMMLGRIKDSHIVDVIDNANFKMGKSVADEYVDLFNKKDSNGEYIYPISNYFEPVKSEKTDPATGKSYEYILPEDFGATWGEIEIWVGDQNSNNNPSRKFYGQGNIYGGGYIPNSSDLTLIGQPTIMRFTPKYNLGLEGTGDADLTDKSDSEVETLREKLTSLYGGNTSVIMWDNEENADYSKSLATGKTADNSNLKDHVHIGTGYFKNVPVTTKSSAKGLFKKLSDDVDAYIYQTVGKVDPDATDRYYEKIADGGVYGGGRKVFAQAFRTIDLAYYGYAEHTPQKPKLLNTIQRADVATIRDCCMDLVGASDFTLSDFKNIYYAINRVGELRMYSSIDKAATLDVGTLDESTGDGILLHQTPRSRNFIALYNRTNHLGAFRSNWTFEDLYHLSDGTGAGEEAADYNTDHAYPTEDGNVSYVNRKHRYIDVYTKYYKLYKIDKEYYALNPEDRKDKTKVEASDIDALALLYEKCTGETMPRGTPAAGESLLTDDIKNSMEDLWKQRNKGTAGNMIGINSGYELSIEGLACQRGEDKESRYYGPAYGVTEIKILTTVSGMGGGYIYALNHHYDSEIDDSQAGTQTSDWCSKFGPDFLNTTGNFVFPGAWYQTTVNNELTSKYNYIIDDCFDHYDPINHGYFECDGHDPVITKAPAMRSGEGSESGSDTGSDTGSGTGTGSSSIDVNYSHEIHYWYVSGNTYVYNVTITGITSDTSPEAPRNFYVDNTSGLVNLFNIKKDTEVWVDEVTWFEHESGGIEDCDLTHHDTDTEHLSTQYKLYLSVFDNTRNTFTDEKAHPGAYVIRIPRHSYLRDDNADNKNPININRDYPDQAFSSDAGMIVRPNLGTWDGVNANSVLVNQYTDTYTDADGKEATNHPFLGVRLVDGQKNRLADEGRDAGIEYYNKHLAGDHNVQVTIQTRNPVYKADGITLDHYDETIYYIINIDIRYLMGPALFGQIEIENCALPGEYIYVNAENVEVLMDENLGVSEQTWRMYPNVNGERVKVETADAKAEITDPDVKYDADNYAYYDLDKEPYTIETTDKVIHIPAYHYQDGWEVAYEVVANGEYFESVLPYYGTKVDPEDKDKTVTDYDKILYGNRLQVHNYHRMKPMYGGNVLDLRPTEDARIYIEDQDDMNYFFEYLDKMQSPTVADGYKRFTTPTGLEVNPQYCDSLDFYLMTPLEVPTTTSDKNLTFAGRLHGMGHNLTIPDGDRYGFINKGRFHNLGFISNSDEDDSHAFKENNGSLYNCFYFNTYGKGSFLGGGTKKIADNHRIANCYENTLTQGELSDLNYKYNEILHLSTEGFRYGQAAYNLNGYYLQKRHILLHGPSASDSWSIDNNSFALAKKDLDLRAEAHDYTPYEVKYIEEYYNNGDYRYAYINSTTHPEALRTEPMPNYFDRLNNRKNGLPISMHDATPDPDGKGSDGHVIDATRWCDNHKEYHPLFDADYIFFGQDQTIDVDETNKTLPCAVTPETRVYRVGGFYGSAADKGYYFNRDAYLDSPVMTAVDFVGYRDKDLYDADGKLKAADREDIDDNGWVIKQSANEPYSSRKGGWHEVYYPPSIDLPWVMEGSTPMHDFEKFTLDTHVTHNLLVYTRDNDKAYGYLSDYHYDGDFKTTKFQEHSDAGIKLHHIVDAVDGPTMYGGYFHLVDEHNFNAPVAFRVKQGWYTRKPTLYADTYVITEEPYVERFKTGWEIICLPFDVAKTYASTTEPTTFKEDMGEITHFFDDEYKGHEYWLRRLVRLDDGKLRFERPTAANRQGTLPDKVGDLMYNNSQLHDLYIEAQYQEGHDELYHDNGEWPRTIHNYRYLTGGVPYIVTYPGKEFYEFDLSGNFYADQADYRKAVPQTISYFVKQKDDDSYVEIPITDYIKDVKYAAADGDYTMVGTFAHATNNPADENVLNRYVEKMWVINDDGTEFEQAPKETTVLPFRGYVYKATSSGASRSLIIGGDVQQIDPDEDEPEAPEEPQTPEEEMQPGVEIWTQGGVIYIRTPYELETNIYNISGQLVRRIKAYKGLNRYSGLTSGFYIVLRTKLYLTK